MMKESFSSKLKDLSAVTVGEASLPPDFFFLNSKKEIKESIKVS